MAIKDKFVNNFFLGMKRDTTEKLQPKDTYRFALNATLDSEKRGALQSEKGYDVSVTLDDDQIIIGAQKLDDHKWLLFSHDDSTNESQLNIHDPIDNTLTNLVTTTTFNWNTTNLIDPLLKIINGCDRVIYFTDNLNPYRAINIDDIDQYTGFTSGVFEADKTNVSRPINNTPNFDAVTVRNTGGVNVLVGTYSFGVAYTDKYGNDTNVIMTSNPVPIYQDPVDGQYGSIQGNRNNVNVAGGIPPVNKSIKIDLSNLDREFEFFKIYSFHSVSGTGEITAVFEHPRVEIKDGEGTYIFTGTNDAITSTLAEAEVGKTLINKVGAHAQLDGRLYIANTEDLDLDWATIQQAANENIESTWVTDSFVSTSNGQNTTGIPNPKDCKTATGYTDYRTYMRDEVYAYGIQGRIKRNGRLTPVFHIPGRTTISSGDPLIASGNIHCITAGTHMRNEVPGGTDWDTQLLTVIAAAPTNGTSEVTLDNVRHLGFSSITDDPYGDGPGKIQRWRVFNTAIAPQLDTAGNATTGLAMAYWESAIDYPDQRDCNNLRIYPDGKIRHHKFPDTNMWRHSANVAANDEDVQKIIIGISFDISAFIAALPASITDEIESWEIVRAERTDADISVIDKGIIYQQATDLEGEETAPTLFRTQLLNFVSPKSMFTKEWMGSGFLKVERVMFAEDSTPGILLAGQAGIAHRDPVMYDMLTDETFHRKITEAIYLSPPFPYYGSGVSANEGAPNIEDTISGIVVDSNRYSIHQFTLYCEDGLPVYGNPYGTADSGVDLANSRVAQYCSIKRTNDTAYSNFDNLRYYRISNKSGYTSGETLFGGDSFVHKYVYREKFTFPITDPWSRPVTGTLVEHVGESTLNVELRTKGGGDLFPVPLHNGWGVSSLNTEDIKDPSFYNNNQDRYQDWLDYNLDYSQTNRVGANVQIQSNFDFCSECLNSAPYRIYFSDKSFQEEISDNYREIRFNNYRDLSGQDGNVTNLFIQSDNLYAQTPISTWFLPTRPQQLTTNESTVEIGTGDFLSLPPKRLSSPSYAYGGNTDKFGLISTEFGTVWLDSKSGIVFMLSAQDMSDISLEGMSTFFRDNGKFTLDNQFIDAYQISYPVRSTASRIGIGVTTCYDPELNRVIIHKKDYEIIDTSAVTWTGTQWEAVSNPGVAIYFNNGTYFRDISFTISYSMADQAWVSYHSYLPSFLWNDESNFYHSEVNDSRVFSHNNILHLKSAGAYSQFQVDFIINPNPLVTKTMTSQDITMDTEIYDTTSRQYVSTDDVTFSNVTFYNSYQGNGQQRVTIKTPFDSVLDPLAPFSVLMEKVDRGWHVSDIKNYVEDYTIPLWTSATSAAGVLRTENAAAFNQSKSQFEYERLRDKWFGTTLYWAKGSPYRISIDSITTTYSQSFR